jgi:ABC-type dipeptide/oligopeptide/nickel transport system permease subunit
MAQQRAVPAMLMGAERGGASGGGVAALFRAAGWPGWIGLGALVSLVLVCFVTLPWSLARQRAPVVEKESGQFRMIDVGARFDVQNRAALRLPPGWWPWKNERFAQAYAAASEHKALTAMAIERKTSVEALVEQGIKPTAELLQTHRAWYLMGTDHLGRSIWARSLVGGAISLTIGIAAASLSVLLGTVYGMTAGYFGGRLDDVMMRAVDVLYGLPYVLLVVLLAVAVDGAVENLQAGGLELTSGQRQTVNLVTLLVAIGGVSWLTMARVIRGQVLSLKAQPFMEAARALGLPVWRQFARHILPNLVGPIVVYATLTVPQAILQESFLSFLGIGVKPPMPSWGNLAADGLSELNTVRSHWWLLVFPCVFLAATLLSLNFVGEALREALDPKRSRSR